MQDLSTRLSFFEELLYSSKNISLWRYAVDGTVLSESRYANPAAGTALFVEGTFEYARDYGISHDEPVVLSNSLNMLWIAVFEKKQGTLKQIHVIGPVLADDVSMKSLQNNAGKHTLSVQSVCGFREFIRWIPILPVTNFLQYGMMLHYCVTGERIMEGQFHFQASAPMDEQIQKVEATPERTHGTWAAEQTMLKLVEDGNLNYREAMDEIAMTGNVGQLSVGDPLRQMKNTIISSIVLVSRAAIRGGLQSELAYSLSDKYIQLTEQCTKITELGLLNHAMMNDYVQRVHEVKIAENSTAFVENCKSYIELHLQDEIDCNKLAKEMGYAPYYLSRKFRREAGEDLRIYIRNARLDYSRLMLKDRMLSVQEISDELHFCSQSYFSQRFRERFGMTPAEYRNS